MLLATFASLRWGEATALRRCDIDVSRGAYGAGRVCRAFDRRAGARPPEVTCWPPRGRHPDAIIPLLQEPSRYLSGTPGALFSRAPRAGRCGGATSTRCPPGRTRSARSARKACTFTIFVTPGTTSRPSSGAGLRDLMARMGHDSERAAMIYQHQARGADKSDYERDRRARPGRAATWRR